MKDSMASLSDAMQAHILNRFFAQVIKYLQTNKMWQKYKTLLISPRYELLSPRRPQMCWHRKLMTCVCSAWMKPSKKLKAALSIWPNSLNAEIVTLERKTSLFKSLKINSSVDDSLLLFEWTRRTKKTSSVKISGLECGCGVTWHHKLNSYEIIMPTNSMWGGKNPAICEQWIGSVLYR